MNSRTTIDISAGTIFKAILIALSFVFVYLLKDVLVILILAIVIASAVEPFASSLEKRGLPRLASVLMLYLTVFILLLFLMSLVVPFFSFEVSELSKALPSFVTKISGVLETAQQSPGVGYFDVFSEIQNFLDSFSQFLQVSSHSALNLVTGVFGGVFSFFAVAVISFYLSVMPKGITTFIQSILPDEYEDYVIDLWRRSERKVGRWFQGQLLLALSVGLAVFIGLSLMGFKYALLLSIFAMFLELIPIAGPVISAIPAVLIGFGTSSSLGLWVLIFYIVLQQIESHVLTPLILGRTLGLNPVTVIIAILIGGTLSGLLGIILAVPIAVVIVEMLDDLAEKKQSRRAVKV